MFGSLFREKMARVERVALHIVAPSLPKRDGATGPCIPRLQWPVSAPEGQERAGDAPPRQAIRLIMRAIERRGGAILLTDCMGVHGLSKSLGISCTHRRGEDGRGRTPS